MIQLRNASFPTDFRSNPPELRTQGLLCTFLPGYMVDDIFLNAERQYMTVGSGYLLGHNRQEIFFFLCPPCVVIQGIMVIAESAEGQSHSAHGTAHLLRRLAYIIVPAVNRAAVNTVMMQVSRIIPFFPQIHKSL